MVKSRLRWRVSRADTPWIGAIGLSIGAATAGLAKVLEPAISTTAQTFWATAVAASATSAGALAVSMLRSRRDSTGAKQRAIETHTRGGARSIAHVSNESLGVHRPIRDASAFLVRDIFVEVCRDLVSRRSIMIVGPSMSGKTRLAAEAVRRACAGLSVIIPDSGSSLQHLLTEGGRPQNCIIWLDDLETYLTGGLTAGTFERLSNDGNVLVATIRLTELEAFSLNDEIKPTGWDVIPLLKEHRMGSRLSSAELMLVSDSPYADLADSTSTYGLAEYLGGAPLAWARFSRSETTHPLAWANTRAAVDWYRITRGPIAEAVLADLESAYLPTHRRHDKFDRAEQLDWASARVNETVRLLIPAADNSWLPFDYVLDRISAANEPIVSDTWDQVAAVSLSSEATVTAGTSAFTAGKSDLAEELWKRCVTEGEGPERAAAAFNLGVLYHVLENDEKAQELYETAIQTQDRVQAPRAAVNLGALRQSQGDDDGAMQAYKVAIDSQDEEQAMMARMNIGTVLLGQGDFEGAAETYAAIAASDHRLAQSASFALGLAATDAGDLATAEASYRAVLDSADVELAPQAGINLGLLLSKQGDLEDAARVYSTVVKLKHPNYSPMASLNLAGMLAESGHQTAAAAAFFAAIESGHSDHAPRAWFGLGLSRREAGDLAGAEEAYEKVLESGHPDEAPKAAVNLAVLLDARGESTQAEQLYSGAMESGHAEYSPLAAMNLGVLRQSKGDDLGACDAYRMAIDSGHPQQAPLAAFNLGTLLRQLGDNEHAEEALVLAMNSGHPDIGPKAGVNLGAVRLATQDYVGARQAFDFAIGTEDAEQVARARLGLGKLLEETGDLTSAVATYRLVVASGPRIFADKALMALRRLRESL